MTERHPIDEANAEELIQSAVDAIGPDDPNDYRIKPTAFREELGNSAPALADVLSHSSLTETAKRYEEQDAKANRTQLLFKLLSLIGVWALFVATAAGASLASLPTIGSEILAVPHGTIATSLGFCALVSGFVAAVALYGVGEGKLLQNWMTARAKAETDRVDYFRRAVERVVDSDSNDPKVQLLCLELFRRYQLAVQQRYFRDRGASHEVSRQWTLCVGAVAAGILSLGSGGFGMWASDEPGILPLAALGTIGAALAVVATRREELHRDAQNAERYQKASDALSRIRERHSDVQTAIAFGDSSILIPYVAAVHEQLILEHRQWLAATEEIDTTLKELYASLDGHAEEGGRGDKTGHGAGAAPAG